MFNSGSVVTIPPTGFFNPAGGSGSNTILQAYFTFLRSQAKAETYPFTSLVNKIKEGSSSIGTAFDVSRMAVDSSAFGIRRTR